MARGLLRSPGHLGIQVPHRRWRLARGEESSLGFGGLVFPTARGSSNNEPMGFATPTETAAFARRLMALLVALW
ncbi:MAG: hypothetical protein KC731_42680, partial [Myxococcales bacterium]|nr:hypothetical protein [Myxococcales bacterium]